MSLFETSGRKLRCLVCAKSLPSRKLADITNAFSTDLTIAETLAQFAGMQLASHPALNEGFICIGDCYKRLRTGIEFQDLLRNALQLCVTEGGKQFVQDETKLEIVEEHVDHQSADQASNDLNLFGRPFTAPLQAEYVNARMSFNNLEYLELTGPMCCGCDFIAKTVQGLMGHTNVSHKNRNTDDCDTSYLCDACYGTFEDDFQLRMHRQWFLNTEVFLCKRCSYGFTTKERLMQHLNICIGLANDDGKRVSCDEVTIATDVAMKTNVGAHGDKGDALIDADVDYVTGSMHYESLPATGYGCCFVRCNATFVWEDDLRKHVQELHAVRQKIHQRERTSDRYVCDTCQMGFKSGKTLEHHRNGWRLKKNNVCSHCGKGFVTPGILKEHIQLIHVAASPQFDCAHCGKRFRRKSLLKLHLVTHQHDRRYGCDQCEARFHFGYQLKKHQQSVHTKVFPYECKQCNRKMANKYRYDLHMRMHTGEKPNACRHGCGRMFAHTTDRRRHEMVAHTGEKPHRCGGCSMAYVRRRELRQHYLNFPSHEADDELEGELVKDNK